MPATLPLFLVGVVFALVAGYYARRVRAASGSAAPIRAVALGDSIRQPSLVRIGHIRTATAIGRPLRSTACVAPLDRPDHALVVCGTDGSVLVEVRACEVVMARGWSGGKLLLSFGESRRDYGPSWPQGPQIAGWELHLVTTSGEMVRCYGTPGVRLEGDVDRLRSRLMQAVLASAS